MHDTNCGVPDGALHPHVDRCYRAGRTEALAPVTALVESWANDFADDEEVRMGAVVRDLQTAIASTQESPDE